MDELIAIVMPALVTVVAFLFLRRQGISTDLLVLGCSLFLMPFVGAVFFCYPSMDDWAYAVSGRQDWWLCQQQWYHGWSGRVGATAVLTSWSLIGDPWFAAVVAYRVVLLALMAGLAAGMWDLSKALLQGAQIQPQPRTRLLVAMTLACAWFSSMPDHAEGLYWLAGAITYSGGCCIGLISISCALHARLQTQEMSAWRWRAAVLAAFIAPLFSEVVAVLICSTFALLLMVTRGRDRWRLVAPLLAALVGLAFVALAPGNSVRTLEAARQGQLSGAHDVVSLVGAVMALSVGFLKGSSLAASAALALLVAVLIAKDTASSATRTALGILGATLLMIGVAAVPLAWTGMSPQRAWNPVSLLVSIGLITAALYGGATTPVRVCLGLVMGGSLLWRLGIFADALGIFFGVWTLVIVVFAWRRDSSWQSIAAALVLGLTLGSTLWTEAMRDVFGRGPSYVMAQQQRFDQYARSSPGSSVVVNRLPGDMPYLYHHEDIHINKNTWQNVSLAEFFGLASVRQTGSSMSQNRTIEPTHSTP